jgi:hypothetical protein
MHANLDERLNTLTNTDLRSLRVAVDKAQDSFERSKLDNQEKHRLVQTLKIQVERVSEIQESFKDELADQLTSLRKVQGRLDNQVISLESVKDKLKAALQGQYQPQKQKASHPQPLLSKSGENEGFTETTGAVTTMATELSDPDTYAVMAIKELQQQQRQLEIQLHKRNQQVADKVKKSLNHQIRADLDPVKKKLLNKVDTAVLEELLQHLATRDELKRATEKWSTHIKALSSAKAGVPPSRADPATTLSDESLAGLVQNASERLGYHADMKEIAAQLQRDFQEVKSQVQGLENYLLTMNGSSFSEWDVSAVSKSTADHFTRNEVGADTVPDAGETDGRNAYQKASGDQAASKKGEKSSQFDRHTKMDGGLPKLGDYDDFSKGKSTLYADKSALLERVKLYMKGFESRWWSALDEWLYREMARKVEDAVLNKLDQVVGARAASKDNSSQDESFVLSSEKSSFLSSAPSVVGGMVGTAATNHDVPTGSGQATVGSASNNYRVALQDLVDQMSVKLSREFDEKLFLLCSDLCACKVAYQAAAKQPFYRCGQWRWKSSVLKFGSAIPWNFETYNTDPDNFKWEEDQAFIKVNEPGLYEITFAFFTKAKPSIQLVVNGESVLSAINSPTYVVHHSSGLIQNADGIIEPGTLTGLSLLVRMK